MFLCRTFFTAYAANKVLKESTKTVYQLAFLTPGNSPLCACSLKHKRQRPNFLIYPRGLPQIRHRFLYRILYLNFFFSRTSLAVLAIYVSVIYNSPAKKKYNINIYLSFFSNGIPSFANNFLAVFEFFAFVTMVTSKPCALDFVKSISGKTACS